MPRSSTARRPASGSPLPSIRIRPARSDGRSGGAPVYYARWRTDGEDRLRRVGPAWVEPDGDGGWRPRRGRTPDGHFDRRSVLVAAADLVVTVEAEIAAERIAASTVPPVTVRQLAHEWLTHLEHVEDAKPSTLRNYRSRLAEPGAKHRRGDGLSEGRLMAAFGDRPAIEVTPKEVAAWLRQLDDAGLSPRNVNQHRQILHAIYAFGMRADTHELPRNPVAGAPRRREAPPTLLDHYEMAEVEALARQCERGAHRKPPSFRGVRFEHREAEQEFRRQENHRDADFFRLLFYSGLRLSEALALRWSDVQFVEDMSGAVLLVSRNISDGQETSTKSRQTRAVPVPRAGAEALARLGKRTYFLGPTDYVFCNRIGRRLDGSALRRRYHAAAEAAGLRRLKLHGLRHAAGSVMARTMPLVSIRDILGHAKLQTTNRYLHSKVDGAAVAAVNAAFSSPSHARTDSVDVARTTERLE